MSSSELKNLIEQLSDKNPDTRANAAAILADYASKGLTDGSALPKLVKLLEDENENACGNAAKALGWYADKGGLMDASALPKLVKLLEDTNANTRWNASDTLSWYVYKGGLTDGSALPKLVKLLEDENENIRWSAVYALGEYASKGLTDKSALPKLVELLKDEHEDRRKRAEETLDAYAKCYHVSREELVRNPSPPEGYIEPEVSPPAVVPQPLPAGKVSVERGGEVKGDRYIFKVKVKNDTPYNITNVKVILTRYPKDCLSCEPTSSEVREITVIESGGLESPEFELKPGKDCVKGTINALVSYVDYLNKLHEIETEPFPISVICGLLKPQPIENKEFEPLIKEWVNTDGYRELKGMNAKSVFERTRDALSRCNFYILDSHEVPVEGKFVGVIKGFAQGKYSKKRVGVVLEIQGDVSGGGASVSVMTWAEEEGMLAPTMQELLTEIKIMEEKQDKTQRTLEEGFEKIEEQFRIAAQKGELPILWFLAKEEAGEKEKEGSYFSRLKGFLVENKDKMKKLVIDELIMVPICAHMGQHCEFKLSKPIKIQELTDFAHKLLCAAQIVLSFLPPLIQTFGPASAVISKIGNIGSSGVEKGLSLLHDELGDKISEMKPATVKELEALLEDSEKREVLEYCFQDTRKEWFRIYNGLNNDQRDLIKKKIMEKENNTNFELCEMGHFICKTCANEGIDCPPAIKTKPEKLKSQP
jgi:hypothetical protein